MTLRTENLVEGIRHRTPGLPVRLTAAACLLISANTGVPMVADASDVKRNTAIECVVADGQGVVDSGRGKDPDTTANTRQQFSQWVFAQEGVDLRDRIGLFWDPVTERQASLRIAIDGPVSKPAQLVSITDDSVSAVVMTSDQDTTRSWLFTINFRQELVMASGISSNTGGMKGQMMALSCSFEETGVSSAQAADSWRRCCSSE